MADRPAHGRLPPGTVVGRYTITRRIGTGGMAAVYEATHTELRKRVALKVLHPSIAESVRARRRFVREGRAASRVRHPHVVDIVDVGEADDLPFLVMELLEGEDLAALLAREGPLPATRAVDLLLPVLSAVDAVHAASIIHRDLKPANIFLAQVEHGPQVPKLLDFGISKIVDSRSAPDNSREGVLGTPHYMAPEQVTGVGDDPRSDQYALGVILYECITGATPFRGETVFGLLGTILFGHPASPRSAVPDLSPDLEALILRAIRRDPGSRFASVRALGRELLAFASPLTQATWAWAFADPAAAVADPAVGVVPGVVSARSAVPERAVPDATPTAPMDAQGVRDPRAMGPYGAEALRALPTLLGYTDDELAVLSRVAPAWEFPEGSALLIQGTEGRSCLLLVKGEVEVVKSVPGGEYLLNTLGPGAILGQIALIDRAPRSASVIARGDAVALELGRDDFERLLAACSPFALRIQEQIAVNGVRQLRHATNRLATLLGEAPDAGIALTYVQAAVNEWNLDLDAPPGPQPR